MEPAQPGEDVTDHVTREVTCQTEEGVTDGVEVHREDATCGLVQELEATALVAEDAGGPFQRHVYDHKKWKISLLNGYSSWYKHAINKFLIDNSASCSSQDIQVFEN